MWYLSNEFSIPISDCDATLAMAFAHHIKGFDKNHIDSALVQSNVRMLGRGNWSNLMTWCKAICEKDTLWFSEPKPFDLDGKWAVVVSAHALTVQLRKHIWKECEEALGQLRFTLARSVPGCSAEWEL